MFKGVDMGVVATSLVTIAFVVLMPVAVVLWARRRLGVSWKVVGWGALAFAVSQLLTRLPLTQALQYALRDELKSSELFRNVMLVVLCLSAGLFEETARLWVFARPLKAWRRWRDAVGFGVGHGGLESVLLVGGMAALGLVNMVALANLDPSTLPLTPEQVAEVVKAKATFAALRWWEPLLGAYERVGAMVMHVAFSVLVLQRYVRGSIRWYWLAVGFHALANLVAVVVGQAWGPLAAEGVVTVTALVGLAIIVHFRRDEVAREVGGTLPPEVAVSGS
ncbi:YhfC family intramembrane metalloprotease [Myxococcus eversor]|uniref:YhfC family intramembrane metalloprotease n=1 Tax=Myxococcus eversor TaxID=2709661 RepID=UPI0013D44D2E|nr:YhfC family glutamic-type intramembrane protease [Myxococcus eversor]